MSRASRENYPPRLLTAPEPSAPFRYDAGGVAPREILAPRWSEVDGDNLRPRRHQNRPEEGVSCIDRTDRLPGHQADNAAPAWLSIENVRADAVGHSRRGRLDRIPCQMCVSRSRVNLVVAQELPDHAQALAERQRPRSETVSNVVESHVLKVRPLCPLAVILGAGGDSERWVGV